MLLLTIVPEVSKATENIIFVSEKLSVEMILSILALAISIITAIIEYVWNKAINITNLESEFYKNIYFDYLMKKIPEARQEIRYNNGKVCDVVKLTDVLNDMRQDSLFFKYKDKGFYNSLKQKLQNLEDYLVKSNDKEMDADDFVEFNSEINCKIEEIYDFIMKKYKG